MENEKSSNWGGPRKGAGRPRQYVKVPHLTHNQRSEGEQLTPTSDLYIYLADVDDEADYRRGIVIGEIWYGAKEALAIAQFVQEHKQWLSE